MTTTATNATSEHRHCGWFGQLRIVLIGLGLTSLCSLPTNAFAQTTRPERFIGDRPLYQPLHARMPPGQAAYMKNFGERPQCPYYQAFQVRMPSEGKATVYHSGVQTIPLTGNTQAGLLVGHVYRLKLQDMPELPGLELYPTIEVLDRLHPPQGRETAYPVPVEFSLDELEAAAAGGLVTKVVYLEQPDLATPQPQADRIPTATLHSRANVLAETDRVGRPLAIVRLGGRVPVNPSADIDFYGTGAPAIPMRAATNPKQ